MSKILAGISTRGWQAGLEPVGEQVDRAAAGTSKSAITAATSGHGDRAGRAARLCAR